MKKVNEMKFVGTYAVDDDYRVDVFENDERFEAWLYNKNYGVKSSMFAWFKVQAAGEKVYTLEDFLELVEANADGYIDDYREDYEEDFEEDEDMKKWYLIEMVDGDQFETELNVASGEQAIEEATAIWNRLSKHDKNRRTEFFVCYADTDEDGCIDFDSITEDYSIMD